MEITLKEWSNECGDGCCYNWGVTLTVDGVIVDHHFASEADALTNVLETLGHEVVVEYEDEE